ncbi:MAG TPA: fucose isomerase [Candidatus Pullichristensenella stercorigallinarum]|uniref:Fucose isomerase n=1 Tax=Candidatus Pullichristensenella stercorigallinarum TaxID=2840909 RepID=A0A9D0ZLV9_9FIRM|nr:fucose isomerase [Candidatus Pullichristensenella stercorigallinarum]
MLKGIPAILSPELLKVMMEMGHGDEITIGDGNYPAAATAKRLIRLDGHGVCEILDAMLKFLPLDTYVDEPVLLMQTTPGDNADTSIWNDYRAIVEKHQPGTKVGFLERFAFYDRAAQSYAVVATGETAVYANIILKKGVVK